jgi:hypothetical protein
LPCSVMVNIVISFGESFHLDLERPCILQITEAFVL